MEEKKLLNEKELNQVSGGIGNPKQGCGPVPSEGIIGTPYTTVEAGYYYSSSAKLKSGDVTVYIWLNGLGGFGYGTEYFYIDEEGWWTQRKSDCARFTEEEIKAQFPFRLNVRP